MAIFGANTEPVLDWISKQSGFLGFFKKDCADLRKEISEYGGEENLLYALQNDLEPEDQKFKDYVKKKDAENKAKEAAELARKQAEEARVAQFERDVSSAVAAGVNAKKVASSKKVYEAACKRDWRSCADNSDYVNINGGPRAKFACKSEAEKYARAEVDWGGWLDPNFGSYRTGNSIHTSGTIVLIDDVAKFQNGFGAMIRTKTYCEIYVKNDKVIRVFFN
jgi:hypothetical protein